MAESPTTRIFRIIDRGPNALRWHQQLRFVIGGELMLIAARLLTLGGQPLIRLAAKRGAHVFTVHRKPWPAARKTAPADSPETELSAGAGGSAGSPQGEDATGEF